MAVPAPAAAPATIGIVLLCFAGAPVRTACPGVTEDIDTFPMPVVVAVRALETADDTVAIAVPVESELPKR